MSKDEMQRFLNLEAWRGTEELEAWRALGLILDIEYPHPELVPEDGEEHPGL